MLKIYSTFSAFVYMFIYYVFIIHNELELWQVANMENKEKSNLQASNIFAPLNVFLKPLFSYSFGILKNQTPPQNTFLFLLLFMTLANNV